MTQNPEDSEVDSAAIDAEAERELLESIDWTPFSKADYWADRCTTPEGLAWVLHAYWWRVEVVKQDLEVGAGHLQLESEELLSFADILTTWAGRPNMKHSLAIDAQPAMELAFICRRLDGTELQPIQREFALNAIDRVCGLLRIAMLNYGPEDTPQAVEDNAAQAEAEKPKRHHAEWMAENPPLGREWEDQKPYEIVGTQSLIARALGVHEQTLKKMVRDGKAHAQKLPRLSDRQNRMKFWLADKELHHQIRKRVSELRSIDGKPKT
ncbi:MAG: hypothetical protein CL946_03935 [Ectothiorhodospiraceae bacterium]|nr:hypothetical protein [Ectothiorhodospiraceae bacterium]